MLVLVTIWSSGKSSIRKNVIDALEYVKTISKNVYQISIFFIDLKPPVIHFFYQKEMILYRMRVYQDKRKRFLKKNYIFKKTRLKGMAGISLVF